MKFYSQVLPIRVNGLVSIARKEIFAFSNEDEADQVREDEVSSLATDADVVRLLSRSSEPTVWMSTGVEALGKLHQLLVYPI